MKAPAIPVEIKSQRTTTKVASVADVKRGDGGRPSPSSAPAQYSDDMMGFAHEIQVPTRFMDEWVLWSFLEKRFGQDGNFDIVVSLLGICFLKHANFQVADSKFVTI